MKNALKVLASIAVLGAVGALVAGCGSSSSTSSSTPSTAATVSTTPPSAAAPVAVSASASALAFDKTSLTAAAGDVTFDFTNPGTLPHNLSIKGTDGTKIGGSDTVTGKVGAPAVAAPFTVNLKPGTYTFYCSVAGHEAGGMTGTLTVQ